MSSPFHVEVVQKRESRAAKEHIIELVLTFLNNYASLSPGVAVSSSELRSQPELAAHVEAITFCDVEHERDVAPAAAELRVLVHALHERGAEPEWLPADGEDAAAELWPLPARELHGLWESLVFDDSLKRDTVRLVETALALGARGVDPLVVAWNRVVLLHGPPGTGKTSLCRALAHKLAVRLAPRFPRARLVEIHAHSLFSKWFSESGKLVARLFARVHELAADPRLLACVLLDEVESLAAARRAAAAALEPADAVRAVNALLTQLDRLRRLPNVLVLATSNVSACIDVAFADRADIKRRVGPPSARAAYHILRGCALELAARGAARPAALAPAHAAPAAEPGSPAARLWALCAAAAARGVSARVLRRLPFLALALHVPPGLAPEPAELVRALGAALDAHLQEEEAFFAPDLAPATDVR